MVRERPELGLWSAPSRAHPASALTCHRLESEPATQIADRAILVTQAREGARYKLSPGLGPGNEMRARFRGREGGRYNASRERLW
ncbi:MAG: hypothetical protein QOC81_5164 [Thermoanaerobaculia bacterium]|nr:hypothetical protein [Thermoanaerobaculia bacterium]